MKLSNDYLKLVIRVRELDEDAADYLVDEAPKLGSFRDRGSLMLTFDWPETPQGDLYWRELAEQLDAQIDYTITEAVAPDPSDPRKINVGNSNYPDLKIQPWDIWLAWRLNGWDADIIKRIGRTKEEPGMTAMEARKMDYQKIKHDCDECIRQIDAGEYVR